MNRVRLNNATVFVTVLGVCLGLMAAGASSEAHRTAKSVLSDITSATSANLAYAHASGQSLTHTAIYNSTALPFASSGENGSASILYRNPNLQSASRTILIVTHMPRASIDSLPA
jgi:hypothetical protein